MNEFAYISKDAFMQILLTVCKSIFAKRTHTEKNIRRFYGKITGNQLPVHFPFFLRAPENIFRNQAQYGSKMTCIAFGHFALKLQKSIFECYHLT